MFNVVKWDGRTEPFQREKVVRTLLRMGAPYELTEELSRQIEAKLYDGISTKEILDMVYEGLKENREVVALRRDLRTALGNMRPAPDFEEYVRIVLRAHGYRVAPNRVIRGFCVTHEIDGIAEKDGETIYLEVKHHADAHNYTPFGVTLEAKAKLDDIKEGFKKGLNQQSFDRVLIVCNTRLTEHARRYAECVGLDHIGWNFPKKRGFEAMIEEEKLYPITILEGLTEEERDKLAEKGIITLKKLLKAGSKKIDVPKPRMSKLIEEAKRMLKT